MKKILNILKKLIDVITSKYFIFIILLVLLIFFFFTCQSNRELKNEIFIKQHNIEALNDSVKITKNKNGELQYSIMSLIASEKELKDLNKKLYEEVQNQNGKVITLSNAILLLKQDSSVLANKLNQTLSKLDSLVKINDSTYVSNWVARFDYDPKNYSIINGKTIINVKEFNPLNFGINTNILGIESQIDLTFGQKMVGDKLHIFVQSSHPGLSVESLRGVYIDTNTLPFRQNTRHWFTRPAIGPSLTIGYDINRKKWIPVVGVSLMLPIYQW